MSPRRAYGTGSVYARGDTLWIQWTVAPGERRRQSTKIKVDEPSATKRAESILRQRLTEAEAGAPGLHEHRILTVKTMLEMVAADYRANARPTLKLLPAITRHLCRLLGEDTPAARIDEAGITWYQGQRLAEMTNRGKPVKPATINRELATLRRGFRLAIRSRRLQRRPDFSMLREDNVRKGFADRDQLDALLPHFDRDLQPLIFTAYVTGWRMASELQTRRRHHLDLKDGWLRIDPGEDKNRRGRMFKLTAELASVLQAQEARTQALEKKRGVIIPWLFHRDGRPFRDIDRAWKTACRKAGLPWLLRHDFRRSAVRNLERAGVPRSAAMAAVGHATESVYRRYAIVDERMLRDVADRLDEASKPQHGSGRNSKSLNRKK